MLNEIRMYDNQRYECVAFEPYSRRDGTTTTLAVWESACARCGATFRFKTPESATKFSPNRRCEKHKRPSCRVKAA